MPNPTRALPPNPIRQSDLTMRARGHPEEPLSFEDDSYYLSSDNRTNMDEDYDSDSDRLSPTPNETMSAHSLETKRLSSGTCSEDEDQPCLSGHQSITSTSTRLPVTSVPFSQRRIRKKCRRRWEFPHLIAANSVVISFLVLYSALGVASGLGTPLIK